MKKALIFIYQGKVYSIDESGILKEETVGSENTVHSTGSKGEVFESVEKIFLCSICKIFEKLKKSFDVTFVITVEEKNLLKEFLSKGAIKSVYWLDFFEEVIDSISFDQQNKVVIQKLLCN
jgi:hypothetical protein